MVEGGLFLLCSKPSTLNPKPEALNPLTLTAVHPRLIDEKHTTLGFPEYRKGWVAVKELKLSYYNGYVYIYIQIYSA